MEHWNIKPPEQNSFRIFALHSVWCYIIVMESNFRMARDNHSLPCLVKKNKRNSELRHVLSELLRSNWDSSDFSLCDSYEGLSTTEKDGEKNYNLNYICYLWMWFKTVVKCNNSTFCLSTRRMKRRRRKSPQTPW